MIKDKATDDLDAILTEIQKILDTKPQPLALPSREPKPMTPEFFRFDPEFWEECEKMQW